jgi:O-antigen/teichoic acid export membrane protein
MSLVKKGTAFFGPKLRAVMHFMTAQGITLVGNLIYGLLCIRLLPTSEYAKFVVMFGVQGTLVTLMDVNFSGSLVPLIGERVGDLKLIADYVASLRSLAYRVYLVVAAGLVVLFPFLVKNRHWSWQTVTGLVVTLLVSTWFIRIQSAYGAVLVMLRDRNKWYFGQMVASLGSLALLGVFWATHTLTAFVAIFLNVAGYIFAGVLYYYRSRKLLGTDGVSTPAKRKAIVRLALPNVPQSIFYALQGQVALLLITYFGRTAGVASVGALGRLGQIFALIMQMNPILVEPYFSKLPQNKLKKSYLAALTIAAFGCAVVTILASLYPEFFLWVLGPQYAGLRYEVLLVIAASAISTFSSVLWFIHSARRFIYWWANILNIVLIFLAQLLFVLKADLTTVRTVLLMNLATNAVSLLINMLSGVYGFVKGPREVEDVPSTAALEEAELTALQAREP